MIASAQDRGTREKQNTNGVIEPIVERRLSAKVRPGYRPCTRPPASITRNAQAGQSGSSLGPKRKTHRTAQADLDTLDDRDDGLVRLVADEIGECHFQAHAGDQEPDDTERRGEAKGKKADAAGNRGCQNHREQGRHEQAARKVCCQQCGGSAKDRVSG